MEIFSIDRIMLDKIKSNVINLENDYNNWGLNDMIGKYKFKYDRSTEACYFHVTKSLKPDNFQKGLLSLQEIHLELLEEIADLYKIHSKNEIRDIIK